MSNTTHEIVPDMTEGQTCWRVQTHGGGLLAKFYTSEARELSRLFLRAWQKEQAKPKKPVVK